MTERERFEQYMIGWEDYIDYDVAWSIWQKARNIELPEVHTTKDELYERVIELNKKVSYYEGLISTLSETAAAHSTRSFLEEIMKKKEVK